MQPSQRRHRLEHRSRAGYTLVEVLVVVGIIGTLMGLFAFFWVSTEPARRSAEGASQLQQWLFMARQRAMYERAPRGVRLLREIDQGKMTPYIAEAQFIEQPEDFTGGVAFTPPDGMSNHVVLKGVDITGGFPTEKELWQVQLGDYFQLHHAGLMHRIDRIQLVTGGGGQVTSALVELPLPGLLHPVTFPTRDYRIVRRPRPLGDEILRLPEKVAVDLTTNARFGNPLPINPDGSIDILFSPKGNVLGNFAGDKLIFWVREISDRSDSPDPFFGDPTLIVVFLSTGSVQAYDVDVRNKSNPYAVIR